MQRLAILSELWAFFRQRKRWWLLPLVITLVLVGGLMAVAQASAVFPFLYPLF